MACVYNRERVTLDIAFILVRASDKRVAKEEEYSDSEDEGDNRKDGRSHKELPLKKKQRLIKDDLGKRPTPSPTPPPPVEETKPTPVATTAVTATTIEPAVDITNITETAPAETVMDTADTIDDNTATPIER